MLEHTSIIAITFTLSAALWFFNRMLQPTQRELLAIPVTEDKAKISRYLQEQRALTDRIEMRYRMIGFALIATSILAGYYSLALFLGN